jgi:hypothetical protein
VRKSIKILTAMLLGVGLVGVASAQSDQYGMSLQTELTTAANGAVTTIPQANVDKDWGVACSHCGGMIKVLACIEDQPVIDQILNHLDSKGTWLTPMSLIPESTGPPAAQLF